ncbi:class I SAM-dependent methyltransferase [Bradyrhizobium sp. USDA 4502]
MTRTQVLGGYDDGYDNCNCFWGTAPGSLVQTFIESNPKLDGMRVLDLGCGEGKNAAAFARSGATVTAVDCSARALDNGRAAFSSSEIEWCQSDARSFLAVCDSFDVIVMYGLLHCLASSDEVEEMVQSALRKTRPEGYHFVVAFNDGPHDLSAHPLFSPVLLPHSFYLDQYAGQTILSHSNAVIHETHPHNGIPHFHSLTRILARTAK